MCSITGYIRLASHQEAGRGGLHLVTGRLPRAERTEDRHRLRHALELLHPQGFQGEDAVEQARRHGTQHHRIGGRQALATRRNVGGVAHGKLLLAYPTADGAHDRNPRVQAHADRHTHAVLRHQASVERFHGVHNGQPGVYRPLDSIFVGIRIAKVNEQAIAQILRHVAIKGLDRYHSGLLVGADHGPVVFRIELLREAR
jgi:hypothetical protein